MALSIQQPYAELVLRGDLVHTRRSRVTHRRGPVYIFASSKHAEDASAWSRLESTGQQPATGCIVGRAILRDCVQVKDGFHWVLSDVERFPEPLRPTNSPQPTFWRPKF